jgi:hypothetical protein
MKRSIITFFLISIFFACMAFSADLASSVISEIGAFKLILEKQVHVEHGTRFVFRTPVGKGGYDVYIWKYGSPEDSQKKFRSERSSMLNGLVKTPPFKFGDQIAFSKSENSWTTVIQVGDSVLWIRTNLLSYEDGKRVVAALVKVVEAHASKAAGNRGGSGARQAPVTHPPASVR